MMDGHIVYQGLTKESTAHFAKLGMICPAQSNPADYYMRVLSVNYPKSEDDEKHVSAILNHYKQNIEPRIKGDHEKVKCPAIDLADYQKTKAGFCT
jgi:hypothetical protein